MDATFVLRLVLLTGAYVGAGKLGISLRVAHGVITPVWAPTGLALAALLLWGLRVWPAVFLGALITNATSGTSLGAATGIAAGNTAEALVGAYVLQRVGFEVSLERVRDVLALIVVALFATAIAATVGTVTLLLAGSITAGSYGSNWVLWWFGDLIGALLVTPVLLVWARGRPLQRRQALEACLLVLALGGVGWVVFFGGRWQYPYVLFPLLVWATLRFGQRGAVTAIFVVAGLGVGGSLNGAVAIRGATETQTVQILQALVGVVGVALMIMAASIEEREQAEEARRIEHRRAEELRARFLTMATHEMRTPLAIMTGFADLILEQWDETSDADKHDSLRRVSEQGHRLGRLVSDLLASSQVDSGGLVVRSRFLDLNDVVADVVRGVDPEIAVSTNSRTLVLADRDHVEQMLVNYLSNAGKYGRPPLHVAVTRDDGYAVVRVSDAGDGVDEDFVPKLFGRFSRAPSAAANRIAGTGLGLSIVRDLARAQRGDAWYEPNEPQGACFCIKLPLATHREST